MGARVSCEKSKNKIKCKIHVIKAGKTLNSDKAFMDKLIKRGAECVDSPEDSDAVIVFCPIVSRYESDINAALSSLPEIGGEKEVIVVAMHHTCDQHYTLPSHRQWDRAVHLLVHCLFFEKKGLLKCRCNESSHSMVCKQLQDLNKSAVPQIDEA